MIVIAALYQFNHLPDYKEVQPILKKMCNRLKIKGSLLLAEEGINGTVAGERIAIDQLLDYLKERFKNLEYKESFAESCPFFRMKVRLKKEIVTMGMSNIDPIQSSVNYVDHKEWNNLISDPEVIVIDTRNDYEIKVGTFKGALNPNISTFRQFPDFVQKNLLNKKDKKIAMFCTGGIRCEKSTSYLKYLGFKQVYHLKGGILKYLEEIKPENSLWQGECFVFDQRTAVKHGVEVGSFDKCYGCRMPLSEADKASMHYLEGIHCHHCYGTRDKIHYDRAAERQKQVQLAKLRHQNHIGDETRKCNINYCN